MSKQFAVQAGPYTFDVEATRFGASDGELLFYDEDEKIVHQFHSWTGVRTLTPAPAEAVPQAPANESEAYRKGWENRMLRESPEFRDKMRGWDDAEQAAKAARESKES